MNLWKRTKRAGVGTLALLAASAVGVMTTPTPAAACGGLFCNSALSQAVNQTAERVVFVHNDDGTVTAIIEIMYEGPTNEFAWLLPVEGVPDVGVSSKRVLDQLQQMTNPVYTLSTTVEGTCSDQARSAGAGGGSASFGNVGATPSAQAGSGADNGVTVEASGAVGPYDYVVINVDTTLDDPAQVGVDWLEDNGYDVGDIGAEVLRPYLESDMNLLAFKLTKGNSVGSIRPVMITYEGNDSSIPIRPTAVAAAEDMGIMVWVMGNGRAVPKNYMSLELNEALIDWFNPMDRYNDVVIRAADEAEGQGFVTEHSDTTQLFVDSIFPMWERQSWNDFQSQRPANGFDLVANAIQQYGSYDGFDQAIAQGLTLPDGVELSDLVNCARCYEDQVGTVDQNMFLEALYSNVIKPLLDSHEAILSQPTFTRMYTTMSADEMTKDPIFDINNDLDPVSNQHNATRIIECSSKVTQSEAPWRVELPQGTVVRAAQGTGSVWPVAIDDQPATLKVLQLATTGQGEEVMDNTDMIMKLLEVPLTPGGSTNAGTSGGGGGSGGPLEPMMSSSRDGGLCSVARPGAAGGAASLALWSLALVWLGRRRRGQGRRGAGV